MVGGKLQTFEPISNTVEQWQQATETCWQTLLRLSTVLSKTRGFTLAQGPGPTGPLMRHCNIEASSPAVGQVLAQVVNSLNADNLTGRKVHSYVWDLVYDPNWNKYVVSFYLVRSDVSATVQAGITPPQSAASQPASQKVPNRNGAYTSTKPPK